MSQLTYEERMMEDSALLSLMNFLDKYGIRHDRDTYQGIWTKVMGNDIGIDPCYGKLFCIKRVEDCIIFYFDGCEYEDNYLPELTVFYYKHPFRSNAFSREVSPTEFKKILKACVQAERKQ